VLFANVGVRNSAVETAAGQTVAAWAGNTGVFVAVAPRGGGFGAPERHPDRAARDLLNVAEATVGSPLHDVDHRAFASLAELIPCDRRVSVRVHRHACDTDVARHAVDRPEPSARWPTRQEQRSRDGLPLYCCCQSTIASPRRSIASNCAESFEIEGRLREPWLSMRAIKLDSFGSPGISPSRRSSPPLAGEGRVRLAREDRLGQRGGDWRAGRHR
jgi:hypothetical protein